MPKFVDYVTGKTAITSHADSDIGVMIQGGAVKKFTLTTLKTWIKAITEIADALTKRHTAGTDAGLDTGGSNAVTAADLKTLKDTTVPAKADKVATSPAPTDYLAKFDSNGNLAVSTLTESGVAPIASPTFTGTATVPTASVTGNVTVSPMSTTGAQLKVAGASIQDTHTPGTREVGTANSFGAPTFVGDNSVTVTDASTIYIAGAPSAGANMAITNPHALHIGSGNAKIPTVNELTLTKQATGFTVAGGTSSKTLTVDEDATLSAKANKTLTYIDCSASITSPTLTAAQVSGTCLTNFGQGAEDVQIKLPDAVAGLSFVAVMATAPSGNTWKITAGASDKIYLDGVAGSDGESAIVTPSIGNFCTGFTFQTGESPEAWDWIVQTGQGTWTAGA